MSEFIIKELPNGLRHIHIPSNTGIVHVGLNINAGTRNENNKHNGLAHFIEHILFKGTTTRKTFHILNRIDSVGGELNAYTTKEETCIYASCQLQYLERSLELLSDIAFNSIFPEKEILKEKDVIADEIASYLDSPSEQIFDDFEEIFFGEHPLAKNILGTVETLENIKRSDVLAFVKKYYVPHNMVLSTYGNIKADELEKLILKYFGQRIGSKKNIKTNFINTKLKPFNKVVKKKTNQAHVIIGSPAPDSFDKQRHACSLLNNIFGGPAMNSRLNLNVREKYGFAYNLDSNYTSYTDSGLFTVYFGTEQKHVQKILTLIEKEMKKLTDVRISENNLLSAKRQLIGNIALAQENKCALTLGLGKSLLVHNKVDTLSTVYKQIEKITTTDILEIANNIFDKNKISSLIYQAES